ncbi:MULTISPECIES: aminotransferase class III-fold pyridoxal phosphate-dependent enzyme [unclassified Pseudoalteromonas]|uniref:aminotransferase class III-fold pyridoxal phosphate-dependent enzyme n=1 Tax=unclassified Pseudoalteromonas TaxID=194690 RepID=UPI0025B48821|nr:MULTISPECIES: aminotransferase class III-fold pyridoxal phosphate-dependent enzyme [unclassified Pseudoalteromonas]MDN3378977.1 aminotransferase class III-fold pyridoxal phosphate-dependent enzyme [Pseudoalteromonas sp. APC 3893]MDN3387623.1 aminotransferase class III-fold pyridoxal phosphate-dependent enzyme [Pseudoalteromonas sp. APC 4017]
MSLINSYRKFLTGKLELDIPISTCEYNKIYTKDGRVVRDYLSQYGALPFGHNPEFCVKAVAEHLQNKSPIFTQPIFQEETEVFAQELVDALGGWAKHVTFANSGAETVEVGFKLARIKTGRKKVLSVDRSFHGKTYSALLATNSRRHNIDHLRNSDDSFFKLALNDFDALEKELETQEYAAFIVEPIQGEGGMNVADPLWLERARKLCSKTRTALIFDEIQTGLGRTGAMCAAMDLGITPDILLLAKSLSGGLIPTGAAIYSNWVATPEFDRKHSSTFANNGLATAVGRAVIRELQKDEGAALTHVRKISSLVDQECERLAKQYPGIFSCRGAGLMRALQFKDNQAETNYFVTYMQNSGSLAWLFCSYLLNQHNMMVMPLLSDKCSIRFEPPLNISEQDIKDFFLAVQNVCDVVQNSRYDILFAGLIEKPLSDLPSVEQYYPAARAGQTVPTRNTATGKKRGKKFAFLMHFTVVEDCIRMMPKSMHIHYSEKEIRELAELIMEVGAVDYAPEVALEFTVSNEHSYADGLMIMSPIQARDMMNLSTAEKVNLMKEFIAVAKREDVEFFGLGAYTSVITRGGEQNLNDIEGLSFTTGNSLTALATTETVIEAANYNLIGSVISVIGARGAVGKLMVSELSHWCDNIILMGRPGTEKRLLVELVPILCQLAFSAEQSAQSGSVIDNIQGYIHSCVPELSSYIGALNEVPDQVVTQVCELLLADDLIVSMGLGTSECYQSTLEQSDFVVSATSEGKAFLNTEFLKEGAIAVDTARPFDFIVTPEQKAEVLEGGLVIQPQALRYGDVNMVGLPPGINLACLSETIALAMDGCEGKFSFGKSIAYSQACYVLDVARNQGFKPLGYSSTPSGNDYIDGIESTVSEDKAAALV